jgi:hypothetical protein
VTARHVYAVGYATRQARTAAHRVEAQHPCAADPNVAHRCPIEPGVNCLDYFSYQANVAIPNPITQTIVGVTGQISIDMNANVYVSVGGGVGKSLFFTSGSATFGWIDGSGPITSSEVINFMTGRSVNVAAGIGMLGKGRTESLNTGQRASGYGLYTPQAGATAPYSWMQVGDRVWLVSFMQYDLGYFDDDTCRLEPIENPFGPRVLPMSPE